MTFERRIRGYSILGNNTDLAEIVLLATEVLKDPTLANVFLECIGPILQNTPTFFRERESQRLALYQCLGQITELKHLVPKTYAYLLIQDRLKSDDAVPVYSWRAGDLEYDKNFKF